MKIKHNIWKFFILQFAHRRNFFPLLALFFLTLPNTHVQQIGIYTAIAGVVSFLLEIPSGYFADTFGHKRTLIIGKISMAVSTFLYLTANSLAHFVFASVAQAIAWAMNSGTAQAFLHETLEDLDRKDFGRLLGRIDGTVSLLSAFFILGFPILYAYETLLPFKIMFIIDLIGLLATISLVSPKQRYTIATSFKELALSLRKINFYPTIIFLGLIGGFFFAIVNFRELYVVELGFPLAYIGIIMALSRLIWFFFSMNIAFFERFTLRQVLFFELFLFPLHFLIVAFVKNPYVVGVIFAVVLGYIWGRGPFITDQIIKQFVHNKKYKATILSIKEQVAKIVQVPMVIILAYFMGISFQTGFVVGAGILFTTLSVTFFFVKAK